MRCPTNVNVLICSMSNYVPMYGELYCTFHYQQLFRRKGNYDEGFGHVQHKDLWLQKNNPDTDSQKKKVEKPAGKWRAALKLHSCHDLFCYSRWQLPMLGFVVSASVLLCVRSSDGDSDIMEKAFQQHGWLTIQGPTRWSDLTLWQIVINEWVTCSVLWLQYNQPQAACRANLFHWVNEINLFSSPNWLSEYR